jgi:hypothetical protein
VADGTGFAGLAADIGRRLKKGNCQQRLGGYEASFSRLGSWLQTSAYAH